MFCIFCGQIQLMFWVGTFKRHEKRFLKSFNSFYSIKKIFKDYHNIIFIILYFKKNKAAIFMNNWFYF
jgi:uncharacterized pyridoxamine 5'-phosphate oxidase family protein